MTHFSFSNSGSTDTGGAGWDHAIIARTDGGLDWLNEANIRALEGEDLGVAVIQQARARNQMWSQYTSSQRVPVPEILNLLFGSYVSFMESGKNICLGGSLLTDFYTLPEEMQQETRLLVTEMFQWLQEVLSEGRKKGALAFTGDPGDKALLILSGLQRALQIVRASDETTLHRVIGQIGEELGL